MKNRTETLEIQQKKIKATYLFTHRRSLVIRVLSENEIEIRAPLFLPRYKIDQFVDQKHEWIHRKCSQFIKKEQDTLFYLGEKHKVIRYSSDTIIINDGVMYIPFSFTGEELYQWYGKQSKMIVDDLLKNIVFEKKPSRISIRKQNKRWGSCSSKGNINISGRIAMCPVEVIEYVLYHELCHLVHMNHSKDFYHLLGKYCRDYRQKGKWLKVNHHQLSLEIG